MNRAISLARLRAADAPLDLIVVGGGATGLGAAVDAAARGHRVALLERDDFAKGTSSRSTKLVHGGVRYLRQGNLSLVREALRERGRLARNAPHLVGTQAFVIPAYGHIDRVFYGVGLKAYDWLAGGLGLAPSRLLDRDETLARLPTAEPVGLVGGVLYHDGQFDDARLAINLAQTADALGALVVNHCEVLGLRKQASGAVSGVRARDIETGEEFELRARGVINATGVFVDELRRGDEAGARDLVAVSQGIHLVLPRRFLPGDAALMVPKTADGRVLFAVPWHDRVVVGTTDTPRPHAEVEPRALEEELAFVLEHARRYLALDPTEDDVLSVYAGLRPLVRAAGGADTDTARLSRDHVIVTARSGLVTITGGKWTTYRKMAEDVIDRAERVAGLPHRPCMTATLHIHGAEEASRQGGNGGGFSYYGSDAAEVEALVASEPGFAELLHERLPYRMGDVAWAARREMARTVEDVFARRTRALLLDARASIEAAPKVAACLARELGRDDAWARAQVETYVAVARGYVFTDPASRAAV